MADQALEQTYRVVPDGIEETKSKVSGLFGALKKKAKESNSVLGRVAASIVNIGKSAKVWIAGAAVTGFAALAGAIGKATGEAVQFEKDLQRVATLIDGDVQGSLDRFAQGIDRIRTQLPVTTNLTRALYDAISAGVPQAEALGVLEESARAATAGMTDTRTAVDALTSALNAYGKGVEEAEAVSDSFFQAIDAGKTTFPELASEMGKVLPLASQLGVSLDETNAALATLTTTGLSTAEAATSLRGIFNQLIQGQERFQKAGIEVNEVLGEKGLLGLLQEVQDATGGSASKTRELFRRVEALNGVLALSGEQMGVFATNLANMESKAGSTNEAVSQVEKSVSSLWQVTKNQFSVAFRKLGKEILPTLNEVLRTTNSLLRQATSTDLERLLSTIEQMEGIDPAIEAQLRAVTGVRQAEERFREIRQELEDEEVPVQMKLVKPKGSILDQLSETIGFDVSLTEEPKKVPNFEFRSLEEQSVESLEKRLTSVNKALATHVEQIARLEQQGKEASQEQKDRRKALKLYRSELLDGISLLTRFQAAQEAAKNARDRLGESLSDDPAAGGGASGGGGLPDFLQELVGIESIDEVNPKTREAIGDWAEAFQERVKAQVADVEGALGGEGFTDLFGFDAEAMNEKIAKLRKRLEAGEISPAQFAEEARTVAQEYREELDGIVDATVRLTTMSEEAGRRIKQGLRPARDEALALRTEYINMIAEMEAAGEISADKAAELAKAIRNASDATIESSKSLSDLLTTLSDQGEVAEGTVSAATDAIDALSGKTKDWGNALQDTARAVRGIGDLADQFGDLSDEAQAAIDSTSSLLSNVGRLVELTEKEGISGLGDIFSGASSIGTTISGITAGLGAVGGLVGMIANASGGKTEEQMEKLRNSIREQIRALRKNTEALLEQARVAGDMSENEIEAINELIDELDAAGGDNEQIIELLTQLEETGAFEDVDLVSLFEDLRDAALENVPTQPLAADPTKDQPLLSDAEVQDFITDILLGQADPEDITELIPDQADNVDEFIDAIVSTLPEEFPGLEGMVDQVTENFSEFGESLEGLIREIELRRDALGQSVTELRDVLVERMGDVGFDDPLTEGLQSALEDLDLEDQEAVQTFIDNLTEAFVGDRDLSFLGLEGSFEEFLGEATPADFEELLNTLESTLLGGDGGQQGDFTTDVAFERTITELQANDLLALNREQVEIGRQQRDLLAALVAGRSGGITASALRGALQSGEAFSTSGQGQSKRLVSKSIRGDTVNQQVEINIRGQMTSREIAQKIEKWLDRPRRQSGLFT